jgi:hypothetical protein
MSPFADSVGAATPGLTADEPVKETPLVDLLIKPCPECWRSLPIAVHTGPGDSFQVGWNCPDCTICVDVDSFHPTRYEADWALLIHCVAVCTSAAADDEF